jgi:hypothetical protein
MRLILLVLFAFFVAAEASKNEEFIVGGEDASISDYPYMAGVLNFGLPSLGCPSIFLTNPGFGVFWLKKSGFWS